jgi:hypothetical protein
MFDSKDGNDDVHAMDSTTTAKKLPLGWLILFCGLIAWGVFYILAYTPAVSGWSQGQAYIESVED